MALSLGLVAAFACSKEAPTGPTVAEFNQERDALGKRGANKKEKAAAGAPAHAAAPGAAHMAKAPNAPNAAAAPADNLGGIDRDFVYDDTGKRDPFRSFLFERAGKLAEEVRGPLEQFDLAQLALEAVIWQTGNARALISDPSGETYIVAEGAKMGKNSGRVIAIEDSVVRVTETYVDYLGRETTKDIELRMRRNEGG
jgi:Tfp pilus assembly protein PilP